MIKHICIIFLLFFFFTSCKQSKFENKERNYSQKTPGNIEESIAYFEKNWTDKVKNDFKNKKEQEAVNELHMSVGTWIRNNWIRHGNNNLVIQFNKIGVDNPDDISSIILTSLHRKLNNKELKIEEQAQYYVDYWKPIIDRNEKSKNFALELYNKHKVGDKVNLYYPVNSQNVECNAFLYENNDEWVFDKKNDLKISGIIKEKFYLGNEKNVFFKIEVTEMSNEKCKLLMQEMKVGNTYDFHLDKLTFD